MERFTRCARHGCWVGLTVLIAAGCAADSATDREVALTTQSTAEQPERTPSAGDDQGRASGAKPANSGGERTVDAGSGSESSTADSGPGADPYGPPADLASSQPVDSQGDAGKSNSSRDAAPQRADEARAASKEPGASDGEGWSSERPKWWIDEPRTEEGRILLAAEALGADVLSARRSAVDAGWDALKRALADHPRDFRVEKTFLRPLSGDAGGTRSARYIGYVLISAARSESPESD